MKREMQKEEYKYKVDIELLSRNVRKSIFTMSRIGYLKNIS